MPWKRKPCAVPTCPHPALSGSAYCAAHQSEKVDIYEQHRGNANARGYDYRWRKFAARYLKNNPICADPYHLHVGVTKWAEAVDHIIPLRDGGAKFRYENVQPLCRSCHNYKTSLEKKTRGTNNHDSLTRSRPVVQCIRPEFNY